MSNEPPPIVFDKEHAASYDKQFEKLAPMRDALHLYMRLVLAKLPDDARILCVGAGTGAELLYLAQAYPQWRFTAVDPAGPMLEICQQRAEAQGVAARCTFHEGYLEGLPETEPFDAATSILVSHFLTEREQRTDFFRQIAQRLRPQGYLINTDIAYDMSGPAYSDMVDVWVQMMRYAEIPEERIEHMCAALGQRVAVWPPEEVASVIAEGGFDAPTVFFQALFVHAWYATQSA